jgi:hypothetical protein
MILPASSWIWFNAVDATYQQQLRELNDLNWERVKSEIAALRAELRGDMAVMRADLLKWMFIYWIGSVMTIGGLMVGMLRFGAG